MMATPEYPDYPEGQDPASQFRQGLESAQMQGLPLAGSLPLSGGLPLGGGARPPLAPVRLQQPPVGRIEGIGRMLEGFGSGMRGQVAPWEQIQQAQEDRALRQRQLDQQEAMQRLQMPLIQAQTLSAGIGMFEPLRGLLAGIDADKRGPFLDAIAPALAAIIRGATPDPTGQQFADPGFVRHALDSEADGYKTFLEGYKWLTEEQRQALIPTIRAKDYDKVFKSAKEMQAQNVENIVQGLGPRVAAASIQNELPRTVDQVLDRIKATPKEREAWQLWTSTKSEAEVDRLLTSLNIIPPSIVLAQAKARAEALGKGETPQGQATLEKTKAETEVARVEAQTKGFVPLAEGGTLAEILVNRGGGGAPANISGPVPAQPGTATVGPRGVQTSEKVRIAAQAPKRGEQQTTAKWLVQLEALNATFDQINALRYNEDLRPYTGPAIGRLEGWTKEQREKYGIGGGPELPSDVSRWDQLEGYLRNVLIPEVTGAAVGKDERPDIMRQWPERKTDRWETYWRKLDYAKAVSNVISRRVHKYVAPDGSLRPGMTEEQMRAEFPFPPPPITSNRPVATPGGTPRPYGPSEKK